MKTSHKKKLRGCVPIATPRRRQGTFGVAAKALALLVSAVVVPGPDPRWRGNPGGAGPQRSVAVCSEFVVPQYETSGRVLFVVVDCMRRDQWELLKQPITELFDVEESYYFSILPTATPFSRNAIFSGRTASPSAGC